MDNKPLALRYKTWFLYTFTGWFVILILAGFIVPIVIGLVAIPIFEFDWMASLNFMFAGGLIFLFLLSMLNALLGAYVIRFFWKYRLIFGKTRFGHKTIPYPFIKPFAQRYEDILKVTRGEYRGTIKIVPKTGKPLQIRANIFEGGTERLLEAFSARFRPEQIDPELRETLWKFTKLDRISWGASSISIFFTIIYLGATTPIFPWSPESRWWKPIPGVGNYTYVNAYSIDSDGSVWAISNKDFSDSEYKIWHISAQDQESWSFIKEKTDDGFDRPRQISHDGNGNPWIFFKNTVYYWNNGKWLETTFPHTGLNDISSISHWAVLDSNIWSLIYPDNNTAKLAHWDLSNNQFEIIALPDTQGIKSYDEIKLTPTGELLLLRIPNEPTDSIAIFQLNDINWNLISDYKFPENPGISLAMYSDVTVDSQGFIWLFLPNLNLQKYIVARFNPTTKIWEETQLPNQDNTGVGLLYQGVEIDLKGRLWTEGSTYKTGPGDIQINTSFVAVLQPNWQSSSSISRLYTHDSTNLDTGFGSLQADSMGRIWYGDHWMDANVENLPQPLPLSGNLNILRIFYPVGLFIFFIPFIGILFYFQRKIERENTSKIQSQQPTP